ncbi:PHB depolymerase family esterase [Sphingomonas baiyangensis]|uniref:PHB depolymerase family esterase n=2 Tax=Sphingomonas baiyangensis TaxID=2572576 RepID=A0A4U1L703_9SPHN|nr:PHB depolymerase family esterase [Sphingomonas baiyangensis]
MRSLNDTLNRLSALRSRAVELGGSPDVDRLSDLPSFGSNPGALRARFYVPKALTPAPALVVVLHGCTQDATGYDHGSGWSRLADEQGFALLFPEQQRANNANLCFNWFSPADIKRDSGEALSIRQMVASMVAEHGIDPTRIFVTGLSAGGAMASVMLATYPDVFAGGAIIAGLPFGTASTVPEAFDRMRAHGGPPAGKLASLVTAASPYSGPWPTISVWHGDRDATVSHENARLIVEQWRELHGADVEPIETETIDGHRRRRWCDRNGRAVIEEYHLAGLGHGTPLATTGSDACGAAGAYMLEAGISSTRRIADFWRLGDALVDQKARFRPEGIQGPSAKLLKPPSPASVTHESEPKRKGPARIIEDALRVAGLMR